MKKFLLLISLCAIGSVSQAQKIDKTLITGKWTMASMTADGMILDPEHIGASVSLIISKQKAENPGVEISKDDSTNIAKELSKGIAEFEGSYMEFTKDGKYSASLGFDKDENGKPKTEKGTYKWEDATMISTNTGSEKSDKFVVDSLTAHKMVLSNPISKGDNSHVTLVFKK